MTELARRLGYDDDTALVIVSCDDLGSCHAANVGVYQAVREGAATCASIRHWSERLGTKVRGEKHDWWGADDRKWHLLVEQIIPEHPDLAAHAEKMSTIDYEGRAAVE